MPSSVRALFEAVGLELSGPVRWGDLPEAHSPGVYVVAHVEDPSVASEQEPYEAHIDVARVEEWLSVATEMTLDGRRPDSAAAVCARLREFWLDDEPVLYIGATGTGRSLCERLGDLHCHRLGERSPHRGGHWLQTLEDRRQKWVFWADVTQRGDPRRGVEQEMILAFARSVSSRSRQDLRDPDNPFPWANLEWKPEGRRIVKNHGLAKQARSR